MHRAVFPLAIIALLIWMQFSLSIWWLGTIAMVILTLLAAWQEKEILALQAELDTLRNTEPLPDHEPQSVPIAKVDAAYRRLQRRIETR